MTSRSLTLPASGFLLQYDMAFNLAAGGAALPWYTNWAVLICNFLYSLLHMTFSTHIIIAIYTHVRLQCPAEYLQTAIVENYRRILESLYISCSREPLVEFFLPGVFLLLQEPTPVENFCGHYGRRFFR